MYQWPHTGADGGSAHSQELTEIIVTGARVAPAVGEKLTGLLAAASGQTEEFVLPLGFLSPGETAVIVSAQSGRHPYGSGCPRPQALYRFEAMGLSRGKTIEVLNNRGCGLILIKVDETRIALGRGAAMKIMVRRLG